MQTLDWFILIFSLLFIVVYGAWKTKGSQDVKDYILGNNAFLFGTTSNVEGKYLPPNIEWFKSKLDEHKKKKNNY